MITDEIKAHQVYTLHFGKCTLCDRSFGEGEKIYVGRSIDGALTLACEFCRDKLNTIIKEYIYHPKEYIVPPAKTKLWRYQDFPKFVSLLDSGRLFLTRADKFEDTFEGARGFIFQKDIICSSMKPYIEMKVKSQLIKEGIDNPIDSVINKKVDDEIKKFFEDQEQKRTEYFISCWHANEYESEAMWKLYISSKFQGVAIQTSMERLCNSIGTDEFEVGAVKYSSFDEPLNIESKPIWYKRKAFMHENEVRVVIRKVGTSLSGMLVPVDLEQLIEKIYISPSAPDWFSKLVENVVKKYGLVKTVEHSRLDDKPIY